MTDQDQHLKKVSKSWIKLHLSEKGTSAYNENFWSFDELNDLCEDDPDTAFAIIDMIRSLDASDVILSNLAAGPLEDLLAKHGDIYIDKLEQKASSDEQLRKLLGAVWQNDISDSLWKRIKAISSPSW